MGVSEPDDGPVLVVGAGPTGLTAAIELARRGVDHRIVDAEPEPVEESRALVVQPRTLEVWLDEGVAETALDRGIQVHAFTVQVEDAAPSRVRVEDMGGPFGRPLILAQDVTEPMLVERLEALGGTVERPTELVELSGGPEDPVAVLDGPDGRETVEPSWIVAADGAHSTVRHELDLPFEGVPYPDRFVVADVDLEGDLPADEIRAWIRDGRLLLVVPLRRAGHFRVITTHQPADDPDADPDEPPSHEALQRIVDERSTVPVELDEPRWTSVFRVHCRGVPEYRVGRVLLAGDAAHIHSPAGGQGMNTGVQDAHNLGWKLARVRRGQAPPSLMDSYHDERHPVGQRLLDTTDRAFQLAASDALLAKLARRFVMGPALGTRFVQRRLRRFVSQRHIRYRDSPVVGPDLAGGGPRPGDQAPDGPLLGPDGSTVRLLELLAGTAGHAILAFAGRPAPASLAPVREVVEDALGRGDGLVSAGWIVVPGLESPSAPVVGDPEGALHARYERGAAGYEVVRPDGHLGARSAGLEPDALDDYLDRLDGPTPGQPP